MRASPERAPGFGQSGPRAGSNDEGNGARHDAAVRFADTIAMRLRKLRIPLN